MVKPFLSLDGLVILFGDGLELTGVEVVSVVMGEHTGDEERSISVVIEDEDEERCYGCQEKGAHAQWTTASPWTGHLQGPWGAAHH